MILKIVYSKDCLHERYIVLKDNQILITTPDEGLQGQIAAVVDGSTVIPIYLEHDAYLLSDEGKTLKVINKHF